MKFDKSIFLNYLEQYSNILAPSGHEDIIAHQLATVFHENKLNVYRDGLGGIYAGKGNFEKNDKKRVFIVAHMDEVGFIIKRIDKQGIVEVMPIGGITTETLAGCSVECKTTNGNLIKGVFQALPGHFKGTNDLGATLKVDFGFCDEQEALQSGVEIGNIVGFDTKFSKLSGDNRYSCKAIDNRYGCAMLAYLSKFVAEIEQKNEDIEIILGATVMEEIGLKGAQSLVSSVNPDFVIVLDCSPAADTLSLNNDNGVLGEGVLLRLMDKSSVLPERIKKFQKRVYDANHIKYQSYFSAGGTDASKILELNQGIPTTTCCIAARYIHHAQAIFDVNDIQMAFLATLTLVLNYKKDIHEYLYYKI